MATEVSAVEGIKASSRHLRGNLAAEVAGADERFTNDSTVVLKFHGIYQQDDRDVRAERARQGLGVRSMCMVRAAIPGGVLTPEQYLAADALCDAVGNGTLRVTTRQGLQYHFVAKADLPPLLATLNRHLVTTLGACGDVVRNTMCCPAPRADRDRSGVQDLAAEIARRFRPRTRAYYQLWLDGERAASASPAANDDDDEPLYGTTYLPRKFKMGIAFPGDNCIDLLTHDIGLLPVLDGAGRAAAYTVVVGGGMGKSHTDPTTFPRLADPLTTVDAAGVMDLLEAVVLVQRDHGNRGDRDHARLKYLVDAWGIDAFRAAVGDRLGRPLADPGPVELSGADDHLGWHEQPDGRWFLGVKVENGRIADRPDGVAVRSALRAAVEQFGAGVRFTPREDVLLTGVDAGARAALDAVLAGHGVVPAHRWVPLMRNSFACPALPTCGLALTESERALPGVLDELHSELEALDLGDLDAHVRMTGCPNGCARPYTAEIGLVGRGKRNYDIHLGGEPVGVRMNAVFAENVPRVELANVLRPVLARYAAQRGPDEGLGDWCHRVGVGALRAELGNESWVRRRAAAVAP